MTLSEVRARLSANVPALKSVQGAAEFAALEDNPPKHLQPAAYVVPMGERAGGNRRVNAVRQEVVEQFAVILALGNLRDRHGETASDQLEAIKDAVRAALVGWVPSATESEVLYAGGRMIGLRESVVWWQSEFNVSDQVVQA